MSQKDDHTSWQTPPTLDTLWDELQSIGRNRRIPFTNGKGYDFIPEQDIVYVQANGNYCYLYLLESEHILVSQSMKEIEEKLPAHAFCRIHHSYLINLGHLERYNQGEGGTVVMSGGVELPVSKGRKAAFLGRTRR